METIDQNTHLAEELAEIATELQRSFLVELSTEVNRGNISIPQYTLLGFLNQTSGLNMSQLAELMRHTTPATTGLVERLVEAGLIERFSHPKDRRQVLVRITDKGRELVEGLKRGIVRNLQELFKDLSQEDIEAAHLPHHHSPQHPAAREQEQRLISFPQRKWPLTRAAFFLCSALAAARRSTNRGRKAPQLLPSAGPCLPGYFSDNASHAV